MIERENILNLEIRRRIYSFILNYPGLHLRDISRRMKIPYSTLKYHLNFLEKRELIDKKHGQRYTRYYISNKVGRKEKEILGILQESTPRHIVLFLLVGISSHQNEIGKYLEMHPTTIEFHLKKLLESDIIEIAQPKDGEIVKQDAPILDCSIKSNEIIYMLKDPWAMYDLLIKYKGSLIDDVASSSILEFVNQMISGGIPERVDRTKDAVDKVFDMFFELFPPPFRV